MLSGASSNIRLACQNTMNILHDALKKIYIYIYFIYHVRHALHQIQSALTSPGTATVEGAVETGDAGEVPTAGACPTAACSFLMRSILASFMCPHYALQFSSI